MRNGTSLQLFIDNKLAGSETIDAGAFKASPLSIRIGAQMRGTNSPLEGTLDELALWDSALTSTQRETVYARGLKEINLLAESTPIDPSVSPAHYWKFEAGSGADATGSIPFTVFNGATSTPSGQVGDY